MRHTALSLHRNPTFPISMADVRGFDVRTRDHNEKVGKVDDVVCATDGQLRYLDVSLGGIFSKKRVLLPVGVARVDRSNDVIWVAGLSKEQVKALPDYKGDPEAITEQYERDCCGPHLAGAAAADSRIPAEMHDQGQFYADRGGESARDGRVTLASGAVAERISDAGGEARA